MPTTPRHTIHVGLYVDAFVFFLKLNAEESRFNKLLNKQVSTKFMGDADFFLRSSFKRNRRPYGNLSVHVSQQAFSDHIASRFGFKYLNRDTLMTPYFTGFSIDSIPDPDPDNPDLPKLKADYQSIYGSIN